MRILVVYGTTYGQTAKIGERVAELLRASAHEVVTASADDLRSEHQPANFDGVVIGSSVIGGAHRRSVQEFVVANVRQLNTMPTAFYSVSGSAAGSAPSQQADARRMLDGFLMLTGWRPMVTATIAGAMSFTKYNILLRWTMRRISRKAGGPTDTSRDHELTDWAKVARFVDEVLANFAPANLDDERARALRHSAP
jgi:menaquinone-dependent protoporphyrinogen oxidase